MINLLKKSGYEKHTTPFGVLSEYYDNFSSSVQSGFSSCYVSVLIRTKEELPSIAVKTNFFYKSKYLFCKRKTAQKKSSANNFNSLNTSDSR
jgi:hypothetical protein